MAQKPDDLDDKTLIAAFRARLARQKSAVDDWVGAH